MAQVSVIDLGRTHYLASRGIGDSQDHPRKTSICAHAIISKLDLLVIPDLEKDERFKDHHSVIGHPHIRFYAAAPLNCPEGYKLGTLSIMDTKPRPGGLTLGEKQSFREITDMVMDVMVEHREAKNHEYRQPAQLIASTSNDLITPLRGVISGLAGLQDDEGFQKALTRQQKEVISTVITCSSVMSRMCRKSLQAFRKDSMVANTPTKGDRSDNEESLLNVQELVKHLHTVMEPFPKQVPLVITTAPSVPELVVADDLKVFRSAVNYLTNACGKTKKGSVHLKIYLRDDEEDNDINESQSLVFSVEDTGPGISVDKYRYLFQPVVEDSDPLSSYCVDSLLGSATSQASKATMQTDGLGLYSVATQIKSIGGEYGFRPRGFTENGSQCYDPSGQHLKGSIFWFSIPLVLPKKGEKSCTKPPLDLAFVKSDEKGVSADETMETSDRKRSLQESESEEENEGERKMRALLIEDSTVTRKMMSKMLKKLGFEVYEAENGIEGLKELHSKLFDIVFCDCLMPVMDGIECVKQYRQFEVAHRPWFDQYIVGISGHADEKDFKRALKVGMNDYRTKPVTKEMLEEIMESAEFQYVNSRLDDFDLGDGQEEDEKERVADAKRRRLKKEDNNQVPLVCLVATEDSSLSDLANKITELNSWKAVAVRGGEAAIRLLQMRNWDAVLLDDALSGLTSSRCIAHFREWEQKNRVNRQKNVLQVSSSFIPTQMEVLSSMQLPAGFDGALGKPLSFKVLQTFLQQAQQDSGSQDIVRR
jgi:CheY-like chemotaxis protein